MPSDFLKDKNKVMMFVVFLVILYLSYLVIESFIPTILTGIILAYIFYPIYRLILKYVKNQTISSIITTALILIIALIPSFFIIKYITTDLYNFYQKINLDDLITLLKGIMGNNQQIFDYIVTIMKSVVVFLFNSLSGFIVNLPNIIINGVVLVLTIFYILIDWEQIKDKIKKIKVFSIQQREEIIKQSKITIKAIVYGNFLTAIIEAILLTIGLFIFGVPYAIIWGLISIILIMLPVIGAGTIWVPAVIYLIIKGKIISAILLSLYCGLLISGFMEYVIKPKIIGEKANLHVLIIIVGIIGGLKVFGIIGLVVGPLILSLARDIYKIYMD